ncbi:MULTISPECIES: alpha/beta hydrolase [unclassified Agarivorans]|uniref:alpha/beta hydrolase n=1 Tax=unclassified Agarivorans TaxID=2636026 RepID=UPI003D7DA885
MSLITTPLQSVQQLFPQQAVFRLWSEPSDSSHLKPIVTERSHHLAAPNRALSQTQDPEIIIYPSKQSKGIGVLIIPGGSYRRVVIDQEGSEIAKQLNHFGYHAFILNYRMPGDGHRFAADTPLADAQRALRWIRAHAHRWQLQHIGVLGFSAGGHVAGRLSHQFKQVIYPHHDHIDSFSARPDFSALVYPVISMEQAIAHPESRQLLIGTNPSPQQIAAYSLEQQVSPETPPCFILHASDDPSVSVENSLRLWRALSRHQIATQLHLFERGGHGFGISKTEGLPLAVWPQLLQQWINSQFASK